ncbi:MAG: endonuclease III [Alphaproteobacteria bacterium]|nr:endonuclease III [Alphaproteobacteria bacterium]
MEKENIKKLFDRLLVQFPNPRCELEYINEYTLMVSIILSAQATDRGVNKATAPLYEKVKTPEQMLALGLDGLREYVKSINYYNNKSKNIMAMSQVLIDKFGGKFPRDFDELQTLPGVGRKTANVFLNVAHNAPLIAVDTHVFRLANRLDLAPGKTPLEVEEKLAKVVPDKYKADAQHLLVLFGRYICKATKPDCANCPITDICPYFLQNAGMISDKKDTKRKTKK